MAEEKFISKYTANEIESMLDKVKQDMQIIQYTQSEINALLKKINDANIPTKTSDLTNDSVFITNEVNNLVNYYTKAEIDNMFAALASSEEPTEPEPTEPENPGN